MKRILEQKVVENVCTDCGLKKAGATVCKIPCDRFKLYISGAEFGYSKCFEQVKKLVDENIRLDCIIPELLRLKEEVI